MTFTFITLLLTLNFQTSLNIDLILISQNIFLIFQERVEWSKSNKPNINRYIIQLYYTEFVEIFVFSHANIV